MRYGRYIDRWIAVLFCLVTLILISSCAIGGSRIQVDRAVYFATPDGTEVVVQPGAYRVEQATGSQVQLIPTGGAPPIVLGAKVVQSDIDLRLPTAIAMRFEPDDYDLLLLLPGGSSLMAHGSLSGVQSRGGVGVNPVNRLEAALSGPDLEARIGWVFCGNWCQPRDYFLVVQNLGNVAAGPSKASFGITTYDVPALQPGAGVTVRYFFGAFTGPYQGCFSVDVENVIAETNESNNRLCSQEEATLPHFPKGK